MKKKLLLILPFLSLLYCLEAMFFNVQFNYTIPISSFTDSEPDPSDITPPTVEFSYGMYSKQQKISEAISYLIEEDIPSDGKLEKTIDKLERAILTTRILVFLLGFLLLTSGAVFVSLLMNAWYAPFLGRFLTFISGMIAFQYTTISISHLVYAPSLGYYSFLYNLIVLILMIWGFRVLGKMDNYDEMNFYALYVASLNNEDSNTGKVLIKKRERAPLTKSAILNWFLDSLPVKLVWRLFTNSTLRHFVYIILTGLVIGNLLYIPLFSLQKNYSSEFGILLLVMLVVLSILYIRNYYFFLKEENTVGFRGVVAGAIFLQYRFIRNLLYFIVSSAGVIIFIIALFLILTFNTLILTNYNIIERTLNL